MVIWNLSWPFGIFNSHLVFGIWHLVFWYIFTRFSILFEENYGNPAFNEKQEVTKTSHTGRRFIQLSASDF
jgi:hypothetical protein